MRNRFWTQEEDKYLRDSRQDMTAAQMGQTLQRTTNSVRIRLHLLRDIDEGRDAFEERRLYQYRYGEKTGWSAQRNWTQDNIDKVRARERVENLSPDQHESRKRLWNQHYSSHCEDRKKYQKEYGKLYPDKIKKRNHERTSRYLVGYHQVVKYAKGHLLTVEQAGKLIDKHLEGKMFCAICSRTKEQIPDMGSMGRRGFHLDHIDGNKHNHELSNFQILCWKCNTCKLDMPMCDESKELIKELTDIYYKYKIVNENI